ncbi:MAG: FAD-binding protein [Elusimicrobia bacterium]|nr:FAD-binding protein [Elusimicrobiota bacterium]
MSRLSALAGRLPAAVVLTDEAALLAYSYDGALDRGRPEAVVLARSARDIARAVEFCAANRVPFTARGAGTNLSGGCVPLRGGVVLAMAPMSGILEIDTARGLAVVEPGTVNLELQRQLEGLGFFYAPDPASFKVSTLGGNIAENAGGPRCLKYGVTTHHVLAVEAVMPDGSVERFALDDPGPEIMSLIVGSEGTLAVVTRAWLKITPAPERIRTILAGFPSIGASVECVSEIVRRGVVPRVLEAMDRVTVESVEAYSRAGYPRSEAVLLIELDGSAEQIEADAAEVERLCRAHGAASVRSAADAAERERLWQGRRGAYAAMARLAPNVLVEDGVVPRDRLPEIVRRIQEVTARHGVVAGLLFHAGDGNIHPNMAYDERDRDQTRRVKSAGHEVLQACVELGGSLSGEHGIGVDKREAMAWLFSPETLSLFRRLKQALDPDNIANPDKMLPLGAGGESPRFFRPALRPLSPAAEGLVERVGRAAAERRPMAICGSLSRTGRRPAGLLALETRGLDRIVELDEGNLTATVEAGIPLQALEGGLSERGFHARLPSGGGTLGGLLATKAWPGIREDLLGLRVLLSDGQVCELGGKVVKNVAGYDLARLLLGSQGALALILEVTLRLHVRPQPIAPIQPPKDFIPNRWHRAIKRAFDPANLFNPWIFGP